MTGPALPKGCESIDVLSIGRNVQQIAVMLFSMPYWLADVETSGTAGKNILMI